MKCLKRTLALSLGTLLLLFCGSFLSSVLLRAWAKELKAEIIALPTVSEFEAMRNSESDRAELQEEIKMLGERLEERYRFFSFFIGNDHLNRVKIAYTSLSATVYSSECADYGAARNVLIEAIDNILYVIG